MHYRQWRIMGIRTFIKRYKRLKLLERKYEEARSVVTELYAENSRLEQGIEQLYWIIRGLHEVDRRIFQTENCIDAAIMFLTKNPNGNLLILVPDRRRADQFNRRLRVYRDRIRVAAEADLLRVRGRKFDRIIVDYKCGDYLRMVERGEAKGFREIVTFTTMHVEEGLSREI